MDGTITEGIPALKAGLRARYRPATASTKSAHSRTTGGAYYDATTDPAMRRRAKALSDQIQAEHGVAQAVEVFHRYV
jgi:hypothetical protein